VSVDHFLDAELGQHPPLARLTQTQREIGIVEQLVRVPRKARPISDRDQVSRLARHNQVAIAWDVCRHDGHPAHHRFHDDVGEPLVFAPQPESVEMPEQLCDVGAVSLENGPYPQCTPAAEIATSDRVVVRPQSRADARPSE